MSAAYVALAALAGALLPLQALINARLAAHFGQPLLAALLNFVIGGVALAGMLAATRSAAPTAAQIAGLPWWSVAAGLSGAYFVFSAAIAIPKLGASGLAAVIIASQLAASLALDHFGVLHAAQPMTALKLIGAALLIAGAYLILRPGG
jgi:transporter family-2 protein